MVFRVRALYDLEAQQSTDLSIEVGEILEVIKNADQGWYTARNSQGKEGLIPENYVENLPPVEPPPINNVPFTAVTETIGTASTGFSEHSFSDDDSDWDSDTGTPDFAPTIETLNTPNPGGRTSSNASNAGGLLTVRSGILTRISSQFARNGTEDYLNGSLKVSEEPTSQIYIIETTDGPYWQPPDKVLAISLGQPSKAQKYHGMKKFMTYTLSTPQLDTSVNHRYNQFVWLHKRLTAKFPIICIPPLPDPKAVGRYEEAFIKQRMEDLQQWINRMARHPVISRSEVFRFFLIHTPEKKRKADKLKHKKDEYVGGKFFLTVVKPSNRINLEDANRLIEVFQQFSNQLTANVNEMSTQTASLIKCHEGFLRKEYQRFGVAISNWGKTLLADKRPANLSLANAMVSTGDTFSDIGKMFSEQPDKDLVYFQKSLWEYNGILGRIPEVINYQRKTSNLVRQCHEHEELGHVESHQVGALVDRAETLTYAVLAEVNNFQADRVVDFKDMMVDLLKNQISFYKSVTAKLEVCLENYSRL